MGLFMLAFLDSCPPESCSVDGAVANLVLCASAFIVGGFGYAAAVG
jgi:hypothetical protein